MAVTKIWPVRDRFDKVLDYAANAKKTDADIEKYHALDGVIDYGEREGSLRRHAEALRQDHRQGRLPHVSVLRGGRGGRGYRTQDRREAG